MEDYTQVRQTAKELLKQELNDDKMAELFMDLTLPKDDFKEKYGFENTTALRLFEEVREDYPEEKVRGMFSRTNNKNIYVTGKRIAGAREIRCKITPEAYELYRELMNGYKDTLKAEILSEVLIRGMEGLLGRKRAGESIVRIPAQPEQEL